MLCRLLWSSKSLVLAVLTLSSSPWENSVLSTSTSISSAAREVEEERKKEGETTDLVRAEKQIL